MVTVAQQSRRVLPKHGMTQEAQEWRKQHNPSHPNQGPPTCQGPDIDRINLSPSERVEHLRNQKCFICHKGGCHSSKHKGYPGKRGGPPRSAESNSWRKPTVTKKLKEDLQVHIFLEKHGILEEWAINLLGNYYEEPATNWEGLTKEESVNRISQGFWKRRKDQCLLFPQTFSLDTHWDNYVSVCYTYQNLMLHNCYSNQLSTDCYYGNVICHGTSSQAV